MLYGRIPKVILLTIVVLGHKKKLRNEDPHMNFEAQKQKRQPKCPYAQALYSSLCSIYLTNSVGI